MGNRSVIVVGAGIIGTACAHFLAEDDWQVTIIDQGKFGQGCSHANCGLVCPSHVLPLAEPGAVKGALKAIFAKNSPFYIKPRFDLRLWSWLINFARRCNEHDMIEAGRAISALLDSSMRLYQQIIDQSNLNCEWQKEGLLFVYRDSAELDSYQATNDLLSEQFGHPAQKCSAAEVVKMEPALRPEVAGAWYYDSDAQLRPDRLLSEWQRLLISRGVVIHENSPLQSLKGNGSAAVAITGSVEIPADAFVIATGASTPLLEDQLGHRIPIQPGKGYSMTLRRPKTCPKIPLIFPETRVAVTPMQSAYRLGSMMEFAGYDSSLRRERLELLRRGAEPFLIEPYTDDVEEEWFGWRPMTYDGLPIIGRSAKYQNVWIAAGHNMLGISMAPATGKLVSELLCGHNPHIDPAPYSLTRF